MRAFDRLDLIVQIGIRKRVELRTKLFLADQAGKVASPERRVLLVGDRPAPDAPDDDRFHFVPFGAEHHSSLWLNIQLITAHIPEYSLAWTNAADRHGQPTDPKILKHDWCGIVALGGNAHRWCDKHGALHRLVQHPQAWKRFHSKEPYPLFGIIRSFVGPIIMT